jgi:predicted nucleotidyltransferase
MDVHSAKGAASTVAGRLDGVWLVYLFGSHVEGDLGPMSDHDLGVFLEPAADDDDLRARVAHEMSIALDADCVDAVMLNGAPIELAYAVIAQGELLYEQDVATRVEYEAKVLSLYGDYLPVLRRQRKSVLRGDDYGRRVRRYRAGLRRTERTLGEITAADS